MSEKILRAKTPADLLDKIYAAEGWVRREGEVRSTRAKEAGWVFARDNRRDVYSGSKALGHGEGQ